MPICPGGQYLPFTAWPDRTVPDVQILVVAHAGVNRVILADLMHLELSSLFSISQDYGALNRMERTATGFHIHAINQLPRIPGNPAPHNMD